MIATVFKLPSTIIIVIKTKIIKRNFKQCLTIKIVSNMTIDKNLFFIRLLRNFTQQAINYFE